MQIFFLVLIFFTNPIFGETKNESVEMLLRFHQKDKNGSIINYTFIKKSSDIEKTNAIYVLKLSDNNKQLNEKVINANDATILIAQMNDLLWNFEYKKKVNKGHCSLFSDLEINGSKTIICQKDKIKTAQILGIRSRLDHLLKTTKH